MIHLVQYLCPARHCIIAACYDATTTTRADVERQIKARLIEIKADPFCGICGSTVFHFDDRKTTFPDMDKAMQVCREAERDNLASRAFLDVTGQSYKSKLKQ